MTKKASDKELSELHGQLAKRFKEMLESGEPLKASDHNVIRKFLKDNNIEATAPPGSPLFDLAKNMPVFDQNGDLVQ